MLPPKSNWRAAAELGLLSSTFSTLISQLAAAQVGRDAWVDWMTVAAIPMRDQALSAAPSWSADLAGIAFHQWADFSWALVFFGLLGRWTANLHPLAIFLLAMPWAAFTSATEWFLLVPLFPFWQPLFTLQQPYWIGFLVHASSAAMYPLFAWLRWPRGSAPQTSAVLIAKAWGAGAFGCLAVLGGLAVAAAWNRDLPYMGAERSADQDYIRHMTTHHAQGIEIAQLGVARARDPHLRALAALMAAGQAGENRIFDAWWNGWFGVPMPACTAAERADMSGYLTPEQLQQLRSASAPQFDALFVRLMSLHHYGAVKMADQEWHGSGDVRLRVMAHAIRHEQQGEIALMHRVEGLDAVLQATRNMLTDNVN